MTPKTPVSPQTPMRRGITDPQKQDQLRRHAQQADSDAARYASLLDTARRVVSEVKSALYDADHYGNGAGAEMLLEEAGRMLSQVANNTLAEAAQLQKSTETCVRVRQKMAHHLRENHRSLEGLIRRRTQDARAENDERRAMCDTLWRQIREGEAELEHLPKVKKRGPETRDELAEKDPVELCGLTLEGAQALLRAFATVLRPHITDLMPKDPNQRTPAETIALEFLTAADPAMSPQRDEPPPDVAEAWDEGRVRRIQSSPMVMSGAPVISRKPQGLIALGQPDSANAVNFGPPRRDGGFENSEAKVLMEALGESF